MLLAKNKVSAVYLKMKIDYDRKKPFSSIKLIVEDNDCLTEKQIDEFKRIGLRCVRISYLCIVFSCVAFICQFIDLNNLSKATRQEKIFAIIGYSGFTCLVLSLVFLFIESRKLNKIEGTNYKEKEK